jgi:hypothetical protein
MQRNIAIIIAERSIANILKIQVGARMRIYECHIA